MPGTGHSGGRNRKSAQQHRFEGTYQRVRHGGSVAPEPPKGRPMPPRPLTGEALAEWERMVDRLEASQSLSTVDDAALYAYCRLFADAERLQGEADELQSTWFHKVTVDGSGQEHTEPKIHPVFAQLRQYRMALRQYLVEFGMTPAARSRVKLPEAPDEGDPFAQFDGQVQ